jgi:hypothetical protein
VKATDEKKTDKNRSLGTFELSVGDYVHRELSGEHKMDDTKQIIARPLYAINPQAIGALTFQYSIPPTIPTVNLNEKRNTT